MPDIQPRMYVPPDSMTDEAPVPIAAGQQYAMDDSKRYDPMGLSGMGRSAPGASGGGVKSSPKAPSELYHVAGEGYESGQPLRTLYSQFGNNAYDKYAERWPDAGELGQYHPHRTFFYDTLNEAKSHVEDFGGKILRIDPKQVEDLHIDTLEKSLGGKGFWATQSDVPPSAIKLLGGGR